MRRQDSLPHPQGGSGSLVRIAEGNSTTHIPVKRLADVMPTEQLIDLDHGRGPNAMTMPEPIHPGEHLAEIIDELGISQYRLAKTIGVPPVRINAIVKQRRSITADTALRVGRELGTTPEYWLNLQRMYELDVARAETDLSGIEPLVEVGT